MCFVCGYTSDDFWASFAVEQNGPLSPAAVRLQRARSLCDWVQQATQAVMTRRDPGEAQPGIRLVVDIGNSNEQSSERMSGLFSGAYVKAGNRGYMVSSPTGVMRFCASLYTVVCQIKTQRPDLCHVLDCHWNTDYRNVNWAAWGVAWTWNAVMNDDARALPERVELADGRGLHFEPLNDHKVKVSLESLAVAA